MYKIYLYLKNIIKRNYNKFLFRNVNSNIKRSVTIGDAVCIGVDVSIISGLVIGNGSIISSGSVFFGEVSECTNVR